jgi:hypothetical protein
MVCLRNISVDTLHKGDTDDDYDDNNNYLLLLLTYLLTPWSRVLLEKLTVNFAASQEIPRIYGPQKFLTVPTRARQLSLS